MQVRLAFSVAIKARGDLMLDEVLAVADAAFQQKCFDYFEKVKRSDQTVVFVTHDMNAVRGVLVWLYILRMAIQSILGHLKK